MLTFENFYFQAETQRAVLVESSPSGTHDVEQWPKVLLKPQLVALDKRNKKKGPDPAGGGGGEQLFSLSLSLSLSRARARAFSLSLLSSATHKV